MNISLLLKLSVFASLILGVSLFFKVDTPNKISKDYQRILSNATSGDIIFRKENSYLSDMFAKVDNSNYSHVGILLKENGKFFVYHMESNTQSEDLKIDPIEKFLLLAQKTSIYRYSESVDRKRLYALLNDYKHQNIKFDYKFDLLNNTLYCTEFINEVFFKLFSKNIYTYLYNFNSKKIISVKSILQNPNLIKIIEF